MPWVAGDVQLQLQKGGGCTIITIIIIVKLAISHLALLQQWAELLSNATVE